MSEIPQWAINEALKRCGVDPTEIPLVNWRDRTYAKAVELFAAHIAEHEEPPVDPVDAEIQRITERTYDLLPGDFTRGARSVIEQGVAEAFRRGMELAREANHG